MAPLRSTKLLKNSSERKLSNNVSQQTKATLLGPTSTFLLVLWKTTPFHDLLCWNTPISAGIQVSCPNRKDLVEITPLDVFKRQLRKSRAPNSFPGYQTVNGLLGSIQVNASLSTDVLFGKARKKKEKTREWLSDLICLRKWYFMPPNKTQTPSFIAFLKIDRRRQHQHKLTGGKRCRQRQS